MLAGVGERTIVERSVTELASRDPDSLRRILWQDDWLKSGLDCLHARLKAKRRDAQALYFRALGMVSSDMERAVVVICGGLGVRDAAEAQRLIGMAQDAEGADDAMLDGLATQWIRTKCMSDPTYRRRKMQEIFGVMDVTDTSGGVKQVTNGNGAHA